MKILYVEDENEAREALGKFLKRRYGKIFTAEDGKKGLELFIEQRPDLIIVDLYMPNMDGLEMIKEVRKLNRDVKVIITTAVDDIEVILRSVDAGIDKYLVKPINTDDLIIAIGEFEKALFESKQISNIFEGEGKSQAEDKIKKEFTTFLKNSTGKGPSGVSVFINYDTVSIKAFDAITIMEKNIIDNNQNSIIIEQYRRVFYRVNEKTICNMISEIICSEVKLKDLEFTMDKGINKIEFQILGKLGKH